MPGKVLVWLLLAGAVCGGCSNTQNMGKPWVEFVWPRQAPLQKNVFEGDTPTLTIYLPPKAKSKGVGVVICPGGGYRDLAVYHEGHQVAKWLNSIGAAGFILRYRHSGDGYSHPAPITDAQRALRVVRSRADEFGVNPDKIGILGFSAGGHLAATAGTLYGEKFYGRRDEVDDVSCRPDFMVIVYATTFMDETMKERGLVRNLLGAGADEKSIRKLSPLNHVDANTPPTFLLHTGGDHVVPVEQSVRFYQALREADVQAEMHIYQEGEHGFGLGRPREAVSNWPQDCELWLENLFGNK